MHVSQPQVLHALPALTAVRPLFQVENCICSARLRCIKHSDWYKAELSDLPLQLSFSCVVYPSVVITYLGQAAYLYQNPDDYANTFYASIPNPVYWPMFVIATLAAIVASQVCISTPFSEGIYVSPQPLAQIVSSLSHMCYSRRHVATSDMLYGASRDVEGPRA